MIYTVLKAKITRSLLLLCVLGVFFVFTGTSFAANYVPGQAMVLIKNGIGKINAKSLATHGQSYVNRVASSAGAKVTKTYAALSEARGEIFALVTSESQTTEELIDALRLNPEVVAASPNYILRALKQPNDPKYSALWGMPKIRAEEAWDMTTGDSAIHIAVIDSGIYKTHEDLEQNLDAVRSRNFTDASDYNDANGHGTHVSGTIGAVGDNAVGVAGVNWNAKIIALKVLGDDGTGSSAWTTDALNYLVDILKKDPSLRIPAVNLSLGWYGNFPPEYAPDSDVDWYAYKTLSDLNRTVIVVAAGNESLEVGKPAPYTDPSPYPVFRQGEYCYPASYLGIENFIVVGAVAQSDKAASFSNWSSTRVHIAAPGVNITSTFVPEGDANGDGVNGDNEIYASLDGTSMAAPHVAGAIGLLSAKNPGWTARQLKNALLYNTNAAVNPTPTTGTLQTISRHGLLDIRKALESDGVDVPIIPVTGITVTPGKTSLYIGEQKQFWATVAPSDATDTTVEWSSSKPHVAAIDSDGLVIGKQDGVTVIKARALGGIDVVRTVEVTVTYRSSTSDSDSSGCNTGLGVGALFIFAALALRRR